jgi:hypothetical protein
MKKSIGARIVAKKYKHFNLIMYACDDVWRAGIVDQMVWFRENWYEEVLRQLRAGLAKCYTIAFDNR